jgi:hypothetical protein
VLGWPIIVRGRRSSALQVSLEVINDRPVTSLAAFSPFVENAEKIKQTVFLVFVEPVSKQMAFI